MVPPFKAPALSGSRAPVRFLLTVLITVVAVSAWPPGVTGQAPLLFPHGIMVGDVTDGQALVWTRTNVVATVRVEYGMGAALGEVTPPVRVVAGADFVAKFDLKGLQPATRYYYRATAEAGERRAGTLVGTFRTAPAPGDTMDLTFAWGADTSERFKPFRIFDGIRTREPEFFLFLGDTAYTDIDGSARTVDEYRAGHKRNREDDAFKRFARTTSIYAVWDDHEVANNFDRTHPRLPAGRQAFLEYWPIRQVSSEPARLYRSFRWGRLVEIFILDTRQYRSAASERESASKTMLGVAQKEWLKRELQRSDAVFKVIATSVPLKYHGPDSWEGYTTERQELVNFITQNAIRRVVFLTGDVHYAAVLRHREGFIEAIVGPLAMFINSRRPAAGEPETEFSFNGSFTYGLVKVTGNPPQLLIEIYDVENSLLHRTTVQP